MNLYGGVILAIILSITLAINAQTTIAGANNNNNSNSAVCLQTGFSKAANAYVAFLQSLGGTIKCASDNAGGQISSSLENSLRGAYQNIQSAVDFIQGLRSIFNICPGQGSITTTG